MRLILLFSAKYGTGHVIVLYDFPPTTRTTQLEILFDKFRERGFALRWVNDTVALVVFRTPSTGNFFFFLNFWQYTHVKNLQSASVIFLIAHFSLDNVIFCSLHNYYINRTSYSRYIKAFRCSPISEMEHC